MTATPISKKRYFAWVAIFTFGMFLWAADGVGRFGESIVILSILFLDPKACSQKVARKDVIMVFLIIIVGLILNAASRKGYFQSFDQFDHYLSLILKQPLFYCAVWLLAICIVYRSRVLSGNDQSQIG